MIIIVLTQAGPGRVRRFGQSAAVLIPKVIAVCVKGRGRGHIHVQLYNILYTTSIKHAS